MFIYISLFLTGFIAATLFPLSSEALLATYVLDNNSLLGLWLAATSGNSLGSLFNWWLGRRSLDFQDRRWFPVKPEKLTRAQSWFQRYGYYTLLLAWLPVIGDPLTLVAGVMRVNFFKFLILVVIGKGTRYALVIGLLSVVNQSG